MSDDFDVLRDIKAQEIAEKTKKVRRLLDGGLSTRQIALEAGVSRNWVVHLKRLAGLVPPADVPPEERMDCGCTVRSHLSKAYADKRIERKRLTLVEPGTDVIQ